MSAADPRTYVVGLPVIVTVHPDGFVSVEVDSTELTVEVERAEVEYDAATVAEDVATLDTWTSGHHVAAEGYAQ